MLRKPQNVIPVRRTQESLSAMKRSERSYLSEKPLCIVQAKRLQGRDRADLTFCRGHS